jgi:hypothetical protein
MSDIVTFELMMWKGMDNQPEQLSERDPQTIWDCENVDFDEEGMIIKRRGTQAITLTDS